MTDQPSSYVQGVVEALLFVSEKPVTIEEMKEAIGDVDGRALRQAIDELKAKYESEKRGMVIMEIAGGYQMLSSSEYANAIRTFYRTQKKEKLSKPALESLAIIAYKQPVTRLEVELIRGVNSDGVVNHLLEKSLIKITGRKDVPGRPFEYGTTKEFLEYFGLSTLSDLPKLEEFALLEEKATENIQAFQGVTEEFKQQAAEHGPDEVKVNAEPVLEQSEGQGQSAPVQNENNNTNAEPVASDGGNDEHPQTS